MDEFEEEEEEEEEDELEDDNVKDCEGLKRLLHLHSIGCGYSLQDFEDFASEHNSAENRYDEDNESKTVLDNYVSSLTHERILTRALYTVDWMIDAEIYTSVSSLVYLCCKQITQDANFLKKISTLLPSNRYKMLMKTAISFDFYDSAQILISAWPAKSISLSVIDYANLFRSMRIYYRFYKLDADVVALLVKRIMLLWKTFFEVVKCEPKSRLRVLDLRGVPLGDAMVYFIIRDITALSKNLSPSDTYHVIIDCAISSSCTFEKLRIFLQTAKKYCIKFHVNTIDVVKLNEKQCWTLLQSLDPTELIGLRANPNFSLNFYTKVFKKFSSLKNLDLPKGQLPNIKMLPFQYLPNLRRLGLRTRRRPLSATVPIEMICKLECLNIDGLHSEKIIEDDFRFLMSMPLTLRELDLSGRLMKPNSLHLWRVFLKSLAPTLTILKLNGCIKDEKALPSLVSVILPLINLRCLFFGACDMLIRVLYENLPKLSVLPKLETLRVVGLSKMNLCQVIYSPELLATITESRKTWDWQ